MNYRYLTRGIYGILVFCMLAIVVNGCSKDEDDTTGASKYRTVSQYLIDNGIYLYTTYLYDEQGRIEKLFGSQLYGLFTYTPDSVFYEEYQLDGYLNASFVMRTDDAGRFLNDGYENYQYNTEGNLIMRSSITNPSTYVRNTWLDGNLIKEEYYIDSMLAYTTTITYYPDKPNIAGWDYLHYGFYCFFGRATDDLIKNTTSKDKDGNVQNDVDWSYEFDQNGLPLKVTFHNNSSSFFYSYFFTYESIE